jgi:phosphoglycerate dehydrogenase-like enzyme
LARKSGGAIQASRSGKPGSTFSSVMVVATAGPALGLTVEYRAELKAPDLPEAARHASRLVVRSTEIDERVFAQASSLSLVISAGAG